MADLPYTWLDEVVPDAVVVADAEQRIVWFNLAAEALWGYPRSAVLGEALSVLLPLGVHRVHTAHLHHFATEAAPVRRMDRRAEVRGRRADGSEFPCEVTIARRSRDGAGEFVAIVRDLSSQRTLARLANLGDWTWNLDDGAMRWSTDAQRVVFGESAGAVTRDDFFERLHPEDRPRLERALERFLAGTTGSWLVEARVRPTGVPLRHVRFVGEWAAAGTRQLVCTAQDITEQIAVEQQLDDARTLLHTLYVNAAEPTVLFDLRGRVRSFNAAAQDVAAALGMTLVSGEPLAGPGAEWVAALVGRALHGEPVIEERALERTPPRWYELRVDPLASPENVQRGVVLRARDVTARRAAEEHLRRAQKLDTVGRLAGGVAHDFNNLLTAIAASTELLRHTGNTSHDVVRELDDIEAAVARGAALTRKLLAFARHQPRRVERVEVSRVVSDLERLLQRLLGSHFLLALQLEPGLQVEMDRTELEQLIVNLVVNARDAMPEGGRIAVCTRRVGPWVHLTVSDTGQGMSEEVQQHIFEPFFSTKAPDRGTGLGLSTIRTLLDALGGAIHVRSAPGAGSIFTVELPQARASPALAPPAPRVLLVDPDASVREPLARGLRVAGFEVAEAADGQEALAAVERRAFDLLVTDLELPRMSGLELAKLWRERTPAPVLLISGFAGAAPDLTVLSGPLDWARKPLGPEELSMRARSLLAGRPPVTR